MPKNKTAFASQLISWQQKHGRHHLPWQNTCDAYRIWLSEIMLQQTQVSTVMAYYQRFLERFPTVFDLAAATIDEVLQLWAGLGYYARGRNLHRCAQTIVAQYAGHFPADTEVLTTLPGICRSTAAALGVFAFGCRAAILDGNAKRVFVRCFGVREPIGTSSTEKKLWQLADSLLPETQLREYTQGLMDLGSQVCKRQRPLCHQCPMENICVAFKENLQTELPVRTARKALPERHTVMMLFTDGKQVLLERRPDQGIWGGLLVPPENETDTSTQLAEKLGLSMLQKTPLPLLKHTFTHFRLTIEPIICHVSAPLQLTDQASSPFERVDLEKILDLAVPTPIKRLLKQLVVAIKPNDCYKSS